MINLIKSLIAGLLIAAIGFVLATTSDRSMFRRHVIDETDAITNLRFGVASCMHCPMYFRFEATPQTIERLIVLHDLEPLAVVPNFMDQTVSLFREPWWVDGNTLARAKKYWALYEGQRDSEPKVRMALVDGATVYFATSGYFERANYRKMPPTVPK